MSTKTAAYSFDVSNNGGEKTFTYRKAKLGIKTYVPMLWPGLILGIFLSYQKVSGRYDLQTPTEKLSMGIFYAIIFTLVIPAVVILVMNLLRRPGSFTLKKDGVSLGGSVYPYVDIPSLYIKSPRGQISNQINSKSGYVFAFSSDPVQNTGYGAASALATTAGNVVGVATQISGAAGKGIANSIRAKSFKICFLFGNKEVTLASGMTENQSIQLLRAITNHSSN